MRTNTDHKLVQVVTHQNISPTDPTIGFFSASVLDLFARNGPRSRQGRVFYRFYRPERKKEPKKPDGQLNVPHLFVHFSLKRSSWEKTTKKSFLNLRRSLLRSAYLRSLTFQQILIDVWKMNLYL